MQVWHRVGMLVTTATLGLLTLLPAASFADAPCGHRWGIYDRSDFRQHQRELWQDQGEIRRDQRELWRDRRAHRWGEVARDRRELWQDRRELQRDRWERPWAWYGWWR
jgi:hypothetical protein